MRVLNLNGASRKVSGLCVLAKLPNSDDVYAKRFNTDGNVDYVFNLERANGFAVIDFIVGLLEQNPDRVQVALAGPIELSDIVLTVVTEGATTSELPKVDKLWLLELWRLTSNQRQQPNSNSGERRYG